MVARGRPCLPSVHRCPWNSQPVSGDPYDAETAMNGAHVDVGGAVYYTSVQVSNACACSSGRNRMAAVHRTGFPKNRLSGYYPSYCTSCSTPPGGLRLTSPRYIGSLLARRSSNFFSSITNSWTSGLSAVLVTTCNDSYVHLVGRSQGISLNS